MPKLKMSVKVVTNTEEAMAGSNPSLSKIIGITAPKHPAKAKFITTAKPNTKLNVMFWWSRASMIPPRTAKTTPLQVQDMI